MISHQSYSYFFIKVICKLFFWTIRHGHYVGICQEVNIHTHDFIKSILSPVWLWKFLPSLKMKQIFFVKIFWPIFGKKTNNWKLCKSFLFNFKNVENIVRQFILKQSSFLLHRISLLQTLTQVDWLNWDQLFWLFQTKFKWN